MLQEARKAPTLSMGLRIAWNLASNIFGALCSPLSPVPEASKALYEYARTVYVV
jgi:hypothetical protein